MVLGRLGKLSNWEERGRAALDAVLELLVAQPAAASLCLVESHAAGRAATARVDDAVAGFQSIVERLFAERASGEAMPAEVARAMVGGLRKIIHSRLHRGTEAELAAMAPALFTLALSYSPPPHPLRPPPRRRPQPGGDERRRSGWDREQLADDPAERIVRATIATVAAKGYPAATIGEIAEAAGVSLSTFYEHFDGKAEVFDAALYGGRTRLIGVAMPAFKRARSWPESIRALTRASYAFLAGEPAFAQVVTAGVLGAGPAALEQHELALGAAQWPFAEGGHLLAPEVKDVGVEAVTYFCYALMCEWIQTRGAETLLDAAPLATYLALSPFIGAEGAGAVANGGSWRAEP